MSLSLSLALELLVTLGQTTLNRCVSQLFEPCCFRESDSDSERCSRVSRSRSFWRSRSRSREPTARPSVSWVYLRIPTSIPTQRSGFSSLAGSPLPSTANEAYHSPVRSFLILTSLTVTPSGTSRWMVIGMSTSFETESERTVWPFLLSNSNSNSKPDCT